MSTAALARAWRLGVRTSRGRNETPRKSLVGADDHARRAATHSLLSYGLEAEGHRSGEASYDALRRPAAGGPYVDGRVLRNPGDGRAIGNVFPIRKCKRQNLSRSVARFRLHASARCLGPLQGAYEGDDGRWLRVTHRDEVHRATLDHGPPCHEDGDSVQETRLAGRHAVAADRDVRRVDQDVQEGAAVRGPAGPRGCGIVVAADAAGAGLAGSLSQAIPAMGARTTAATNAPIRRSEFIGSACYRRVLRSTRHSLPKVV